MFFNLADAINTTCCFCIFDSHVCGVGPCDALKIGTDIGSSILFSDIFNCLKDVAFIVNIVIHRY